MAPDANTSPEAKSTVYVVHPNPFSDYIDVQITGPKSYTVFSYCIYAANGTVVKTGTIPGDSKRISGLVNVVPGTYYLSIVDSNRTEVSHTTIIKK